MVNKELLCTDVTNKTIIIIIIIIIKNLAIAHFTVVFLVAKSLYQSEAGGDRSRIQTLNCFHVYFSLSPSLIPVQRLGS